MEKKVKEELNSLFNALIEKLKGRSSALENLEPELSKFTSFKKEYPDFLKKKFFKGSREIQSQVLTLLSAISDKSLVFLLKEIIEEKFLNIETKVRAANILSFLDKALAEKLLPCLSEAIKFKEMFCSQKEAFSEAEVSTQAEGFLRLNKDLWQGLLTQIVEETGEKSLPFISKITLKDPGLDILIVQLLSRITHPESIRLLKEIYEKSQADNLEGAIKKSLFLLKQRGMKTDTTVFKEEAELPVFKPQAPKGEGYLSTLDPDGNQLLIFTMPQPPKGLICFQGVISYDEGIMDFKGLEFTKKAFKGYIAELLGNKNFSLVEADPQYCKFLIEQACRRMETLKKSPPQQYIKLRATFDNKKVSFEQALIYQSVSQDEIEKESVSESQMIKLLDLSEFKGLNIKSEGFEKYLNQLEEMENSKIILNKYQQEERFINLLEEASKEILTKDVKEIIKRKLEEISYVLYKLGKVEESKLSLSAAISITQESLAPGKNPFLLELMMRSILRLKEIKEAKEKAETSLIYKP